MLWEAGPGKPIIWTSAGTEMLAKDSRRTLVAEEAIRCIGFRRSTHLCTIKMFPFPYRHGLWCQTSVLWPKSSPKCLQISQKGTYLKGFIDFFKKSLFLSLCVFLLTEETLVSRSWSYRLLWVAWSDCWGCSSDRATSALEHWAITSVVPGHLLLKYAHLWT